MADTKGKTERTTAEKKALAEQKRHIMKMKERPELSTADIAEIKDWFVYFDKDGNGTLDFQEFKKVIYAMGWNPTEEEIDEIWIYADEDKNGTIDYKEYVELLSCMKKDPGQEKAEIIEAFRKIDKNKGYNMTRDKIKMCFERIGCDFEHLIGDDLERMLDRADLDGDGLISLDEFVTIMLEKPQ